MSERFGSLSDFAALTDKELLALHVGVHVEIKRRDVNAVLQDPNAPRPPPVLPTYTLRAFDPETATYVRWISRKRTVEDAPAVLRARLVDVTVLREDT